MLLSKSDCINGFIEYGKPWKQAFVAPGNKKIATHSKTELREIVKKLFRSGLEKRPEPSAMFNTILKDARRS